MKAIVQDKYGTADDLVFADIDPPIAGTGEVLVRVHAASVFIGDWHVVTGLPYAVRPKIGLRRPKARVRGQEMAGSVEAVGEGVTRFTGGRRRVRHLRRSVRGIRVGSREPARSEAGEPDVRAGGHRGHHGHHRAASGPRQGRREAGADRS